MAKDNKVHMPQSMGGLTRYFDEYKSKVRFKPGHIVVIAVLIMIIVIILHWQGTGWMGLTP